MATGEPRDESSPSTTQGASYGDALLAAVNHLREQPVLLLALAGTIALLALGTVALEDARAIAGAMLLLLLAGIVAWTFLEARRVRSTGSDVQTGSVRIGRGTSIGANSSVNTGISGSVPPATTLKSGDVRFGSSVRSEDGLRINTGVTGSPCGDRAPGDDAKPGRPA